MSQEKVKLYASFDIEADGDVPVKNNMLSIGISFMDSSKKEIRSYQANIHPLDGHVQDERCMREFWDKFPDVWKFVNSNQIDAKQFVSELETILVELKDYDITWVAHPAAYDWQWIKAYYELFKSANAPNIGYSAKCVSTLLWSYCKIHGITNRKDKDKFYDKICEGLELTHNPLDDARKQGTAFINLCNEMVIKL